ncbi:hypothetical protein BA060_09290 [Brucella sp. B13-0095]|nr:hypothetical protein BA060_09290 [Brucella sp. B13-0095]
MHLKWRELMLNSRIKERISVPAFMGLLLLLKYWPLNYHGMQEHTVTNMQHHSSFLVVERKYSVS